MDYAFAERESRLVTRNDGDVELSFHRRALASDVSVVVDQSADLQTWTEIWSIRQPDDRNFAWTQDRVWGTTMTDRYTVTLPAAAEPSTFYRVRYDLSGDQP